MTAIYAHVLVKTNITRYKIAANKSMTIIHNVVIIVQLNRDRDPRYTESKRDRKGISMKNSKSSFMEVRVH